MHVKTTKSYYYIPSEWLKQNVIPLNAGKDMEQVDNSYIADRDVKWYSLSGKQFGKYRVSRKLHSQAFIPEKRYMFMQKPVHKCS